MYFWLIFVKMEFINKKIFKKIFKKIQKNY